MLVILCILWVMNMVLAVSSTNRVWPLNALAALAITIEAARLGL